MTVYLLCLIVSAQQDDIEARIREKLIPLSKTSWKESDRTELAERLAKIVKRSPHDSARFERSLAALPTLLNWYRPRVEPLLSGAYENFNDRFPLPSDLERREVAAAIDIVVTIVAEGLAREPVPEEVLARIREQIDYLAEETRRAVTSRVSGEGASEEIDFALRVSFGMAYSSMGNPFLRGIDRLLSKEEREFVLQQIQIEAGRLDGIVIGPANGQKFGRYSDEQLRAIQDRDARIGLLQEVVGSFGVARKLCHPQASLAIDRWRQIQIEYQAWKNQQTSIAQTENRQDTIIESLQDRGTPAGADSSKQDTMPYSESLRDGKPAAPGTRSTSSQLSYFQVVAAAGVFLIIAFLLYRSMRSK